MTSWFWFRTPSFHAHTCVGRESFRGAYRARRKCSSFVTPPSGQPQYGTSAAGGPLASSFCACSGPAVLIVLVQTPVCQRCQCQCQCPYRSPKLFSRERVGRDGSRAARSALLEQPTFPTHLGMAEPRTAQLPPIRGDAPDRARQLNLLDAVRELTSRCRTAAEAPRWP